MQDFYEWWARPLLLWDAIDDWIRISKQKFWLQTRWYGYVEVYVEKSFRYVDKFVQISLSPNVSFVRIRSVFSSLSVS